MLSEYATTSKPSAVTVSATCRLRQERVANDELIAPDENVTSKMRSTNRRLYQYPSRGTGEVLKASSRPSQFSSSPVALARSREIRTSGRLHCKLLLSP